MERSLNYVPVTLRQIAPSWRNLRHKESTRVKRVSPAFFLLAFFPPPTFRSMIALPYRKSWQYDLNETSHVYLQANGGGQIDFFLPSQMTSISQPYKITFWAILQFLQNKLS